MSETGAQGDIRRVRADLDRLLQRDRLIRESVQGIADLTTTYTTSDDAGRNAAFAAISLKVNAILAVWDE